VFGFVENDVITIGHCGVAKEYRGQGVGSALMVEVEKCVKDLGYHGIALGAVEGAEEFYAKLGYTGSLLIQSEEHSIEELKSLNETFEVIGTNVYDGTINQVWLRLPAIDREFQRKYESTLPGCNTQMTLGKTF
jgi:predicted acetyltransferase